MTPASETALRAMTRALEHIESARRSLGAGQDRLALADLMLATKALSEASYHVARSA